MTRPDSDFRCFDSGPKFADRYTIVPARKYHRTFMDNRLRRWEALAASDNPFHPQGFGQHTECGSPGTWLGKRVPLSSLPADVQRFAQTSLF